MSVWGNKDHVTGNNKPLYANTTNTTSSSTINGTAANTAAYYGIVVGVSPGEMSNVATFALRPQHAGWVSLKVGTGGRAGRITSETLIAMGSMTFDDPRDNVYFTGV